MGDELITTTDVWKRFKIPHEKRTTILENIAGLFQIFEGKRFTYEEFWALKSISFSLAKGESLGIIGENGSGKTTLLKVISNILRPDKGKVIVRGRIAPILELGIGFHPDLTARENISVYGSIMGLKGNEIKERMDSILAFAGLEKFKDAKLKSFSSGMQMRLAFSVATETNPDIYLIDEALAVGDIEFYRKCIGKFEEIKEEKKTIVLVSHDMKLVESFCDRTMFLSRGEMVFLGNTVEAIERYMEDSPGRK